LKEDIVEDLAIIGLKIGKGQESRYLTVLRAVLNAYDRIEEAVSFGDIYDSLIIESEIQVTKAWVHRILKNLVEMGLIRQDIPDATRKKYIANVDTIVTGLEKLKEESREEIDGEIARLSNKMDLVKTVDCGEIAQKFVEYLTGKQQQLLSRFVRGTEELHRVLENNIHGPAGPGDIIRSTMSWQGSWLRDSEKRLAKYFDSARRGADVRWLVDVRVFLSQEFSDAIPLDYAVKMFQEFIKLEKEGKKFEMRLYEGGTTYNQSSLNNEHLALIITESPATATFVTREFNKDLIDDVIKNFDEHWKTGTSFLSASPEDFQRLGLSKNPLMGKIMSKLKQSIQDVDQGNR
jgi:DNA-binding MarR family transcriptional regulator